MANRFPFGIPFLEALLKTPFFEHLPLLREHDYTQFLEIVHTMLTISREHPVHHEAVLRLAKENNFDEWFDAMARGFVRYKDIDEKLSVYFPKPIVDWAIEEESESEHIDMDTSIRADEPITNKSNTTGVQYSTLFGQFTSTL